MKLLEKLKNWFKSEDRRNKAWCACGHETLVDVLNDLPLQKIPIEFHMLVGKLAILKSKKGGRVADYIMWNDIKQLESFKSFVGV